MDAQEKKILAVASASHFLTHFLEMLFPAITLFIYADMKEENPDLKLASVIEAGFLLYLCYGFLALPWGFIGHRFDECKAMGVGMIIAGVGTILAGASTSMAMLWLSLALVGLGIASYHPCGVSLISKSIAERGRALGINGICASIGMMMALFTAGFGGYYLGWRVVFIVCGLFAVLVGALAWGVKTGVQRDTEKASGGTATLAMPWLFCSLFCAVVVLGGLSYRANMVTLPKHFQDYATSVTDLLDRVDWGVAFEISGRTGETRTLGAVLLMAAAYLVSIVGQYMGGIVADRFDLRYGYLAFFTLSLAAAIGMIFLTGWLLATTAAVFLVFNLGMQPIENSLIAKAIAPRYRSTAYAVKFTLALGVGAAAVWIVGIALQTWQTSIAVYVIVAAILGAVVILQGLLIVISRGQPMMNVTSD
jgi:FSR family fosmidomycin resistance protein-like MFS transporter